MNLEEARRISEEHDKLIHAIREAVRGTGPHGYFLDYVETYGEEVHVLWYQDDGMVIDEISQTTTLEKLFGLGKTSS